LGNKYSPYPGDIIDAKLEPGEYVLNRNAVNAIGEEKLDELNNKIAPRFQDGGSVVIERDGKPTGAKEPAMPWRQKVNQFLIKKRMDHLGKKDPQLAYFMSDEYANKKWGGPTYVKGKSSSKFYEDAKGSVDDFLQESEVTFKDGKLKDAIVKSRFAEKVRNGEYGDAEIDEYFGLKTNKGEYNVDPAKWYSKIKMAEGGKVGPGEQARLEAEHMRQAQQMAQFDQYMHDQGVPTSIRDDIQLPMQEGAFFDKGDFDNYLSQYVNLHDIGDSQGRAPWQKGYGELPGIGMDHEIPSMGLTGSEQILSALKAGNLSQIDEYNPAIKKVLKDNPKLGFEYNKQMDVLREKYGPKDLPRLDSDIAYNSDGSISDADDAYLQHKLDERDKHIELKERAKYLKDNPEAMAEHQKKLDAQPSMYDGMDEPLKMKPATKREQVLAELRKGMAGNQDNPYKIGSPGKGIKKHFDKLEKKVARKEKWDAWKSKMKKKIGSFDDMKTSYENVNKARAMYAKQQEKVKAQRGGYMRPDGKQGYFLGGLAAAAAPALLGKLGLGAGAATAGAEAVAGGADGGSLLGQAGKFGTNYLHNAKAGLGQMSKGLKSEMGNSGKSWGGALGDLLQTASMAQGFSGPDGPRKPTPTAENMGMDQVGGDKTPPPPSDTTPTDKTTNETPTTTETVENNANAVKEAAKVTGTEAAEPVSQQGQVGDETLVQTPITGIINPDGSTTEIPVLNADGQVIPNPVGPRKQDGTFQRGGPVTLEGFIQQSWRNM